MNITYVPNRSITLVTSNFKILTATKDTANWAKIEAAVRENNEDALIRAMSMKAAVEDFGGTKKIEIRDGVNVFYRGVKLFGEDVSRILGYISSGAPQKSMMMFLDDKFKNVSPESVASLYNFLNNKEMPITDNGTILGFKGVRADGYSVHTGAEPLISGTRREDGAILNAIGETVWMDRRYVDCNANNSCGPGLHIGSRRYATGWGPRVMIVEFSAADVGMVPNHACEVLRVSKYRIVGELKDGDYLGEIHNGDYSRPNETPEPVELAEDFIEPINNSMPSEEDPDANNIVLEKALIRHCKNVYNISNWSKGQAAGFKDGKAHQKRRFYEVDAGRTFKKYSTEFVAGYLAGYRDGRNS